MASLVTGAISIDRLLAFSFGIFFVGVMLAISIHYPTPTVTQWFTFKLVLALVAGGVGAVLPGALHVGFKGAKAVGASAFFLIVLVLPVEEIATNKPEPPSIDVALASMPSVFAALDSNTLYERMGAAFRKRYSKTVWDLSYKNYVEPLGKATSRQFIGAQQARVLWQWPQGDYLALTYRSKFENAKDPIHEVITFFSDDGKTWTPVGYVISAHVAGMSNP